MAASAIHSCLAITSHFKSFSIRPQSSSSQSHFQSIGSLRFSSNFSDSTFSNGFLSLTSTRRPSRQSIVCEVAPKGKADSAEKRRRQSEKRRLRNKSRKSEARTRMKKVFANLEVLRKKKDAQSEEILSIEKLISEAYAAIDKAVKIGAVHKNTGARRKSRLARKKKAVEIHHGWYVPAAPTVAAPSVAAV
ncbi:Small ribosomal subunit protein bS20c-like protein [Drosera capensis]